MMRRAIIESPYAGETASAQCHGCAAPIRVGLTWCDGCRKAVRREAGKHAARSRKRKVTLARMEEKHAQKN